MECSTEPISVRLARINSQITGKIENLENPNLLARESLLDALQVLYDECSTENLHKYDTNIAQFVEKYKTAIKSIKNLRVNLNDFEIKSIIGRGHFGEVHVVREKQTGDVYAMKTIRKFDSDTKKTSFEEERNIMAFTESNWLTSLQYAFQDNTYLFFIMDYHPGGDLLGLLYRQGGTLPETAATFYIAELILAIEDLHNMGYVHRDIKPDNVLLDRCGHLKLADFGSAARLNNEGMVSKGPPVGTPDYIAPEVLQCLDNKNAGKNAGYGTSCDFWSLGILAYELVIGNTPFQGQSSTSVYAKIMNHTGNLKFPSDSALTQAYVDFVKSLVADRKCRLDRKRIRAHALFKNTNFDSLLDQVPPYVPKINAVDDTSNFTDVQVKKKNPSIESFKRKTQFSGRNLPFLGFTFTHAAGYEAGDAFVMKGTGVKDEAIENLKIENENLRRKVIESDNFGQEKDNMEKKLEERSRKLESVEVLRDKLERDLANTIAECTALKRTLELERKDRAELEKKALDLIKSAKLKWETAEKTKVEAFTLEIEQQKEKISQLTTTNKILNEQLQTALKMEGKHKESLEKVQNLSRRSVIGLESRLDKVTSDSQTTISELQSKLSEEKNRKTALDNTIANLKNNEKKLKEQLNKSRNDYDDLKRKVDEAETVIKTLSCKVNELETDLDTVEDCKKEIGALQMQLEGGKKTIKDLENQNASLKRDLNVAEARREQIDELTRKLNAAVNDKRLTQLESELYEEKEKNAALKKQLQESENNLTENQELKDLRTKFWRMEKEFGNCKIDKRILERELKDSQTEIKNFTVQIEELHKSATETRKKHEEALLELNNLNESLSMELIKAKEIAKNAQEKLNIEKERTTEEKTVMNELKNAIATKEDKIKSLTTETSRIKNENLSLETKVKMLENEKTKLIDLMENLEKEKREIWNQLERARREVENTNLNLNALREACTLLESQVIEYEKINNSFQQKQTEHNSNTEKLINDLCKAKNEIQEAKKLTNEEKSLKIMAESKIKRLEEDIQCLENECASYKEQCIEYKQYSTSLNDELAISEEKIADLEVTMKSYERQIEDALIEANAIKEENSRYLTHIHNLKESNYKLKDQVSELKDVKTGLTQKIRELERVLDEKSNFYKERELKTDATIKQQIKLIDYLQSKVDENSHKKKTLTEVIFGSSKKENLPPKSMAMNYKDLEIQLVRERQENKRLQEEVYRLKASSMREKNGSVLEKVKCASEIMSPRSKSVVEQIVNSPSNRQSCAERMQHNIPHRFESKLCTRSVKCSQCSNQVSIGRNMNVCKECGITAHTNCSSSLPSTCGLPQAFALHYKDSMTKLTKETKPDDVHIEGNVCMDGWIKIPSKSNGWEKRYACLADDALNIYTDHPKENDSKLVESFPLKAEDSRGKVVLEPVSSEIGVPVANSDLPFIIKVEVTPNTTCWPPKCFVFMSLSAKEKDSWFSVLQKIYQDDFDPKIEVLFKVPDDLNINCAVDLTENIKVLATESGLYSYYDGNLVTIDGLTHVQSISLFPQANLVLMIANPKSCLVSCDINHLINLTQCTPSTKPTLKYQPVNVKDLNGFQFVEVSAHKTQKKVCVATSKQVIILEYVFDNHRFVPVRILDTAEPTSCALFTENSLIVGADKFFEIDLNSFQAEEFLDVSDVRLRQAIKCYKMGSYPLSIIQISTDPKEYLLCFNEFSVFVDEYGRTSREIEIKSNHIPVVFKFIKQFLYVVQFSAIEVVKITEETCQDENESPDFVRLEMDRFKYVGCNTRGLYVYQNGAVKFVDGRKMVDNDVSSIVSESTETENESDRFSFTSSMVQSLDGNLSETESVDDPRRRKVKFSQTNL